MSRAVHSHVKQCKVSPLVLSLFGSMAEWWVFITSATALCSFSYKFILNLTSQAKARDTLSIATSESWGVSELVLRTIEEMEEHFVCIWCQQKFWVPLLGKTTALRMVQAERSSSLRLQCFPRWKVRDSTVLSMERADMKL